VSHNYLLDLSKYVDARIASLTGESSNAAEPPKERCRTDGRLAAMKEFQSYLCRDFYPKLPKRLYRQMSTAACGAASPRRSQRAADTYNNRTGGG
jgi:hypothetical protein